MMFNTGDLILDAVILSIVARTPEGTYGYKITQDVRSKIDVPESTFYPLLKQMQVDGYLEVYHKDLGGRSRRFYKITEAGLERLKYCQQNWSNYLQNASSLLSGEANGEAANADAQPAAAPAPQEPAAPAMEVQPQAAPAPQEPVAPAMEVQPQAAPAPQEPVAPAMEVQPQVAPAPQMQAAPAMEVQPQVAPAPQMQAAPAMEVQPQVAPAPQMQAAPAMEVQPQVAPAPQMQVAPTMEVQAGVVPDDSMQMGGVSAMNDFDFSIGGDELLDPAEDGFASDGDLFEFDTLSGGSISVGAEPTDDLGIAPIVDTSEMLYAEPVVPEVDGSQMLYAEPIEPQPVPEAPASYAEPIEPQPVPEAPASFAEPVEPQPAPEAPASYAEPIEPQPVPEAPASYAEPIEPQPVPEAPASFAEPVEPQPAPEAPASYAEPVEPQVESQSVDENEMLYAEPAILEPETPSEMASETDSAAETNEVAETPMEPEDDEADFLAEMALGDAEEDYDDLDTLPGADEDIATVSELESLLTQLRSFENVMTPRENQSGSASSEKSAESATNINITDVNGVAALLGTPAAGTDSTTSNSASSPQGSRYVETRNKDTDDSVNSLVDLLKDDQPKKKRGFFGRSSKKSVSRDMTSGSSSTPTASTSTPTPTVSTSAPTPVPVGGAPVSSEVPVSSSTPHREVRNPDTDDSVNSLVDLLKDEETNSRSRRFRGRSSSRPDAATAFAVSSSRPVPPMSSSNPVLSSSNPVFSSSNPVLSSPTPVPTAPMETAFSKGRPVSKSSPTPVPVSKLARMISSSNPVAQQKQNVREVSEDDGSVDSLVELLRGDKPQEKKVSIFSSKSYSKPTAQNSSEDAGASKAPAEGTTSTPAPAESEPKPQTPNAEKTAEEKTASPDTPSSEKAAEQKSVETKNETAPKENAAPAAEEEKKEEEIPMDSFKYRLMQAHLLPDEDKE